MSSYIGGLSLDWQLPEPIILYQFQLFGRMCDNIFETFLRYFSKIFPCSLTDHILNCFTHCMPSNFVENLPNTLYNAIVTEESGV